MTVLSHLWCITRHGVMGSTHAPTPSGGLGQFARGFRKERTFRNTNIKLAPEVEFEAPNIFNMKRNLVKCSVFTFGFCTVTFVGATIWQHERLRLQKNKNPLLHWAKSHWNDMGGWHNKEGEFRKRMNKWWNELSDGQRVFWPICFLNVVVFACWQLPLLRITMLRYFAFSPSAHAVCWPMLFSTFSHYSLFHLAANMYVMHSFSTPVCNKLGQEQFVAGYLSCGVISSLAGAAFKVMINSPGPSLGASGAIMAMLGYFCTTYPDSQLGIVFIPFFRFTAEQGLIGLLCLDTAGLILRWRVIDHAAHLAGALSGLAYAKWGEAWMRPKRQALMKRWHQIREEIDQVTKSR